MQINTKYAGPSNYQTGRSGTIRYIVLHYTANDGDTARGNCNYFQGKNRKASAHYFVDENEVWQSVKDTDTAWSVGGGLQGAGGHAYYGKCTNSNSISVELCSQVIGGEYIIPYRTEENAAELTRMLMQKYRIPTDRVIRHYDVTGKDCPRPWVRNNAAWLRFKGKLKEETAMTTEERKEYDQKIKALEGRLYSLEHPMIYNYIDENMPEWSKEAVRFFCEKGILAGTDGGLGLTDTKLWMLTILYRALRFVSK